MDLRPTSECECPNHQAIGCSSSSSKYLNTLQYEPWIMTKDSELNLHPIQIPCCIQRCLLSTRNPATQNVSADKDTVPQVTTSARLPKSCIPAFEEGLATKSSHAIVVYHQIPSDSIRFLIGWNLFLHCFVDSCSPMMIAWAGWGKKNKRLSNDKFLFELTSSWSIPGFHA